jgi:hypothetical protein
MVVEYGLMFQSTYLEMNKDEELLLALSSVILAKVLQGNAIERQRSNSRPDLLVLLDGYMHHLAY